MINSVYARLSLMMFFQYLLFAVWWVPFAAYLANIKMFGTGNALLLSSMPIGILASPLIGMVADRYISSDRLLVILNIIYAILILITGFITDHTLLLVILMISMLIYMPSWSLVSSIAMTHTPTEQFPRIRAFGSIGWVASGVFSIAAVGLFNVEFDGTNIPFFISSGLGFVAALLNLTLPKTPPLAKEGKGSFKDAFGLRAVHLLNNRNIAVFIILSTLSVIPFSIYFSYCSEFLLDRGFSYITITMNWGQLAEILILLTIPFAIKKVGFKSTLFIGLLFSVIRYLALYFGLYDGLSMLYFIGILVQGFVFGFFYVGGQVYIDKVAPPELRAQTQGFYFLAVFGLGLLVGNFISRFIIDNFSSPEGDIVIYNWASIWRVEIAMSLVIAILFALFFNNDNIKSVNVK